MEENRILFVSLGTVLFSLMLFWYFLTPPVLHRTCGLGVTSPSILFPAWHNHMFTLKFFKVMSAHTSYNPWFTHTSHTFQLFSEAENTQRSK